MDIKSIQVFHWREESKSFYILEVKSFIKSSSLSLKKRSLSKFLKFSSNMSFLKSSSLSLKKKKKKSLYDFQVPFKPVFHQVIKSFVEEKRCISKLSWNQVFFKEKISLSSHQVFRWRYKSPQNKILQVF